MFIIRLKSHTQTEPSPQFEDQDQQRRTQFCNSCKRSGLVGIKTNIIWRKTPTKTGKPGEKGCTALSLASLSFPGFSPTPHSLPLPQLTDLHKQTLRGSENNNVTQNEFVGSTAWQPCVWQCCQRLLGGGLSWTAIMHVLLLLLGYNLVTFNKCKITFFLFLLV